MIELITERLIMRPIILDDVPDLFELNRDPDVIKYTGDLPFESIEQTREFYANYRQYEKYKMGRFSTFLKSDGTFIGWCGLKVENDQVDLGYRLMKNYWGQGYATESSIASLDYGFNQLDLNEIVAHAMLENIASINIMKKIGMQYMGNIEMEGVEVVHYSITREGFLKN